MGTKTNKKEPSVSWQVLEVMIFFTVLTFIFSFITGSFSDNIKGFADIITAPGQLTLDYFKFGTVGGAFLNVAMTGLGTVLVFAFSGAELNGVSLMAYFLTIGFSFFGMNFLNIWPCIFGTWLFTRVKRQPFAKQVNIAVFSTALAPFVSEGIFRYPTPNFAVSVILGIALGTIAGFLMPILCAHSPNMHLGYTLYNAACVAGFIGIMLAAFLFRFRGVDIPDNTDIGDSYRLIVNCYALIGSGLAFVIGLVKNKGSLKELAGVFRKSGYKCDLVKDFGVPVTWMNIGLFGIFVTGYYNLVGAGMTGPTCGSIICLLAVAPCGAHIFNMIPIMLGYFIASLFGVFTLSTQAIIVGLCFAGALTPVAGSFGMIGGIGAGFLHAMMVTTVVTFHSGLCLYNGGFTCGITAIIYAPILNCFFTPSPTMRYRLLPIRKKEE